MKKLIISLFLIVNSVTICYCHDATSDVGYDESFNKNIDIMITCLEKLKNNFLSEYVIKDMTDIAKYLDYCGDKIEGELLIKKEEK